jgi:hypothetical protein
LERRNEYEEEGKERRKKERRRKITQGLRERERERERESERRAFEGLQLEGLTPPNRGVPDNNNNRSKEKNSFYLK